MLCLGTNRGLAAGEDSSSEEEDEEDEPEDDTTAAARLTAEWGVGAMAANPAEEVPLVNQDTHRCTFHTYLHFNKTDIRDKLALQDLSGEEQ